MFENERIEMTFNPHFCFLQKWGFFFSFFVPLSLHLEV